MRILVVEDEASLRDGIVDLLAGDGHVVRLGTPFGHDLFAGNEALDPESFLVGRTTSEAAVGGGVPVLEVLHGRRLHERRAAVF